MVWGTAIGLGLQAASSLLNNKDNDGGNSNHLRSLAEGAGRSLFSGDMLGTRGGRSTSGTTQTGFDLGKRPALRRAVAQSGQARNRLANDLRRMSGQRSAALQGDLDRQLAAIQGQGQQEIANINQRFNSQQGNVGQNLANRGLYNSTIAPGMSALVERERSRALGNARGRQQQYLGGILGQRAQALDRVRAEQNRGLSQLGLEQYNMNTLLPRAIASSRVSRKTGQQDNRNGGLLSGLFG